MPFALRASLIFSTSFLNSLISRITSFNVVGAIPPNPGDRSECFFFPPIKSSGLYISPKNLTSQYNLYWTLKPKKGSNFSESFS